MKNLPGTCVQIDPGRSQRKSRHVLAKPCRKLADARFQILFAVPFGQAFALAFALVFCLINADL